jgi:hypothetical protein
MKLYHILDSGVRSQEEEKEEKEEKESFSSHLFSLLSYSFFNQ